MNTSADKPSVAQSQSMATALSHTKEGLNHAPPQKNVAQTKAHGTDQTPPPAPTNQTGLPDTLKAGLEHLSGFAMDDVKVHYGSAKPAQLQAHAYAQGTDIHLAPGQEKHLPHEAWHVVQQKQGRVTPTAQLKKGIPINDNQGLEKEADTMGAKALQDIPFGNTGQLRLGSSGAGIVQGVWQRVLMDEDDDQEVWEESEEGHLYDPLTGEWHWGDEDEYDNPMEAERARIPFKIALMKQMDEFEFNEYMQEHPEDEELRDMDQDIQAGSLDAPQPVVVESNEVETIIDMSAMETKAPDKPGEAGSYRVYGEKTESGDWVVVHLKVEDGQLMALDGSKNYRVLNRPYGKNLPFVSEEAGKTAAKPTKEFVEFLEKFGFEVDGGGRMQDRVHQAIVGVLVAGKQEELSEFFRIKQNAEWYTDNIRQGGLNELILTSESTQAAERGLDDAYDPVGIRKGKKYTFVELQRDTSYPTKDFVFKATFDLDGKQFQNSHVNARMYRKDVTGKKHKTVGPVSPQYHLAVSVDSLHSLFKKSHSMKALVGRLIELHKDFLATKQDILKVPASDRGPQIYEMRGGYPLQLNQVRDLKLFADIVDNHTVSVLNQLKRLYDELTDVPNRPPPSPHYMHSPLRQEPPSSPYSPGFSDDEAKN